MEGLSTSQIAVVVLATGLVIVFVVLICLIAIIKLYGTAIHLAQNKKQVKKTADSKPLPSASASAPELTAAQPAVSTVEEGIPLEVVAAISAAVYTLYGKDTPVLSAHRSARAGGRSAWGQAGVLSNTRPF